MTIAWLQGSEEGDAPRCCRRILQWLAGQNLKEKAMPAYEAVTKATPEGTWVKYQWQGKEKNAYVRRTKSGAIVGSGY